MIKSHLLYQLSYVPKTEPEIRKLGSLFLRFGANFDTFKIKLQEKICFFVIFLLFLSFRHRLRSDFPANLAGQHCLNPTNRLNGPSGFQYT